MSELLYREAVRKELVASISRRQSHAGRRRTLMIAATAASAAAAVAVYAFVLAGRDGPHKDSAPETQASHAAAPRPQRAHTTVRRAVASAGPLIDEKQVSLAQAEQDAGFGVLAPDTKLANSSNMTGVYEGNGAGIELRFPAPDPSSDVRQPDITIWEAPWTEGDPLTAYKQDVANDPDPNKSICSVGNLPALCVAAKSPNDATQENPAFVRIVINKVEVELSGGTSVQDLLEIAGSLAPSDS